MLDFRNICRQTLDEKALLPLSCTASSGRFVRQAEIINNIINSVGQYKQAVPAQLDPSMYLETMANSLMEQRTTTTPWTIR